MTFLGGCTYSHSSSLWHCELSCALLFRVVYRREGVILVLVIFPMVVRVHRWIYSTSKILLYIGQITVAMPTSDGILWRWSILSLSLWKVSFLELDIPELGKLLGQFALSLSHLMEMSCAVTDLRADSATHFATCLAPSAVTTYHAVCVLT